MLKSLEIYFFVLNTFARRETLLCICVA